MPDHKTIYFSEARSYDQLVSREDYNGNLIPAILKITSLDGKDMVELGAGTGRLTRLVQPHVKRNIALDNSHHMLQYARFAQAQVESDYPVLAVADHRHIPLPNHCADLVLAGWTLAYLSGWHPQTWIEEVTQAISESKRVLRPGGKMIIIETLGTGRESPQRQPSMEKYLSWLEQNGFQSIWIRTDYQFYDLKEAFELTNFFFGAEMGALVLNNQSNKLPECTGIWWKEF